MNKYMEIQPTAFIFAGVYILSRMTTPPFAKQRKGCSSLEKDSPSSQESTVKLLIVLCLSVGPQDIFLLLN